MEHHVLDTDGEAIDLEEVGYKLIDGKLEVVNLKMQHIFSDFLIKEAERVQSATSVSSAMSKHLLKLEN